MSESDDLRIAIVGCGQIADAHLQEIAKLRGAAVVAVCDREPDLARQAAARFGIPQQYNDLDRMLSDASLNVVHVTTPPHTHFALASACLRHGVHVYVEKPLAISSEETRQLLDLASSQQRLVCVGHDHVFDPVWTDTLHLIQHDAIGRVVHVESEQGYDPSGPFGRVFQTDPTHWIHRLPGGIFQNVISHAVCKVTPFLLDEWPETIVTAFGSSDVCLLPTELRVILRGKSVSANITLLSTAKPVRRLVRLYGTHAGLEVDFDAGLIRKTRPAQMPGAFARIEVPLRQTLEAAKNTAKAVSKFCRSELQYFAGMRILFETFYSAIRNGKAPPVPYEEIQRVANIMDTVFQNAKCR